MRFAQRHQDAGRADYRRRTDHRPRPASHADLLGADPARLAGRGGEQQRSLGIRDLRQLIEDAAASSLGDNGRFVDVVDKTIELHSHPPQAGFSFSESRLEASIVKWDRAGRAVVGRRLLSIADGPSRPLPIALPQQKR